MDSKSIFLESEGDAYFERNIHGDHTRGARTIAEFLRSI